MVNEQYILFPPQDKADRMPIVNDNIKIYWGGGGCLVELALSALTHIQSIVKGFSLECGKLKLDE